MEQKTYTCKHHGELSPELVINRIRNNADGTKKRSPGCRLCKRKIDNLCQRNKTKQLSDSYIKRVLSRASRVMEITPKLIEDTRERLQRLREAKAHL